MATDALTLSVLTRELKDMLVGGKITKICQPEKDEIVLFVFNGHTYKLLISANASVNRIHITDRPFTNPQTAPAFCMLLRKYLANALIREVIQQPFERTLEFVLDNKNDLGYSRALRLIYEMTGKTSNIILTDDNYSILDCLKKLPQNIDSTRLLMTGVKYEFLPARDRVLPCDFDKIKRLVTGVKTPVNETLSSSVLGVSQSALSEILFGIDVDNHGEINAERTAAAFEKYLGKLSSPSPEIVFVNGSPKDVLPFDYSTKNGEKQYYPTLNAAHDAFYYYADKDRRFSDKAKSVNTLLKNAINRTEKKLAIQRQSLADAADAEKFRKYGDLIIAYGANVPSGSKEITVTDYFDENCPAVTLPIDPSLSAVKNAQAYYKKYRKLKSGAIHNSALVKENEKLLEYLTSVKQSLDYCSEKEDLDEITEELVSEGIIKPHGAVNTKKTSVHAEIKPLVYEADGFKIYVGKNNIQNNYVTMKLAKPDDLWLHAKRDHSAHVLIAANGQTVTDEVLTTAAEITAFFSQARSGGKTEIDYTLRKFVRKPPKTARGYVTYTEQKTIVVSPNEHKRNLISL